MRQYVALVNLFWQQMVRRKSLWVLAALAAGALLLETQIVARLDDMLTQGMRYDIASHRAAGALDSIAAQVRSLAVFAALLVGALLAPAARRDGTTQFALTLSVGRLRLALAQFSALAILLTLGVAVAHGGYMLAAYRLGTLEVSELVGSWLMLLLPLLLLSAVSFSLSLTQSFLIVYLLLVMLPDVVLPLLGALATWGDLPHVLRVLIARLIENARLLFPHVDELIAWPRLAIAVPDRPPLPAIGLEMAHTLAAAMLWIVVGLWAHQRHNYGSRIPTK